MSFVTHWTKRIWKRDSSHVFWIWNEASIQPRPWNAMKFRQKSVVLGQCQAQAENSVATHFSSPLSSHEQAARLKWKCYVSGQPSQRFAFCKQKMTSSTLLCPSRVIGLPHWVVNSCEWSTLLLDFFRSGLFFWNERTSLYHHILSMPSAAFQSI